MERDATILFVDLAGFTALTEAHGDVDAVAIAERFFTLARQSLEDGARLVKTLGDGVMIVALEVGAAVTTVLRLFAAIERAPGFPLARAGLHTGPVVERDDDVFGATVNLAARVAAHARSGEILCTGAVAAATTARSESIGAVHLKNIVKPVELFRLAVPQETAAVDPVCRMAITPGDSTVELIIDGWRLVFCSPACAAKFQAAPDDYPSPWPA